MTQEWKNNHAGAYQLTRSQSVHKRCVPYLLFSQPEKRWKGICNVSSSNSSRSVDSVDLVNPLDQPRAPPGSNGSFRKSSSTSNPKHRRSQKLHHPLLITTVPSTTRWKSCRFWKFFAWKSMCTHLPLCSRLWTVPRHATQWHSRILGESPLLEVFQPKHSHSTLRKCSDHPMI